MKKQTANVHALRGTLTTFEELYATSEERQEILRLHVNEVVWKPGEIELGIFETPASSEWKPGFANECYLVTPRGVDTEAQLFPMKVAV